MKTWNSQGQVLKNFNEVSESRYFFFLRSTKERLKIGKSGDNLVRLKGGQAFIKGEYVHCQKLKEQRVGGF